MAVPQQASWLSAPTGALKIVVTDDGARTTIELDGEWDLAQQAAIRETVDAVLARCPEHLVLDLSRLTFIDSTGVHTTVELDRRSADCDIRLEIIPGPRAVHRIFEICELAERLPFVTERAD